MWITDKADCRTLRFYAPPPFRGNFNDDSGANEGKSAVQTSRRRTICRIVSSEMAAVAVTGTRAGPRKACP